MALQASQGNTRTICLWCYHYHQDLTAGWRKNHDWSRTFNVLEKMKLLSAVVSRSAHCRCRWVDVNHVILTYSFTCFYYVDLGEAFDENLCERPADVYGFLWCVMLLTLLSVLCCGSWQSLLWTLKWTPCRCRWIFVVCYCSNSCFVSCCRSWRSLWWTLMWKPCRCRLVNLVCHVINSSALLYVVDLGETRDEHSHERPTDGRGGERRRTRPQHTQKICRLLQSVRCFSSPSFHHSKTIVEEMSFSSRRRYLGCLRVKKNGAVHTVLPSRSKIEFNLEKLLHLSFKHFSDISEKEKKRKLFDNEILIKPCQ